MIPSTSCVITTEQPCTCAYPQCTETRLTASVYCFAHWMAWHEAQALIQAMNEMEETDGGAS